ncbi:Long-chain-fatty-acid--CoA ligase [hydrothermal vent metagenome]|uniref:Long-chain-fatty-acid--CoA ligase n=1 Tax=hydrothermal vent metagenome TaxID=652676 RepID=A0A3B0SVB4_9ZZZZ
MNILKSDMELGEYTPNVGSMFLDNRDSYKTAPAFAERRDGPYKYWSWQQLTRDIICLSAYLLDSGLDPENDDRVSFIAGNSYRRLVCEMAVMSCGLVAVPVFAKYPDDLMEKLIDFSDVRLIISDSPEKISALDPDCLPERCLLLTSPAQGGVDNIENTDYFDDILAQEPDTDKTAHIEQHFRAVKPSQLAMIMYTSGTSGFPKGVQLHHSNIMSQQKALQLMWQPQSGMRFLCYLPWHHSFGGLFERFFALHSGGCLAIDDSFGKDIDRLLENFAEIKPHVYFSVPVIYQAIVGKVLTSEKAEKAFFHDDLKFIFTAAAPLPLSTSDVFRKMKVPVLEAWGLTETSPCCTLTGFSMDRIPGIVGNPIPGVELTLGPDNELLVRGENVMSGYFRNDEATDRAFSDGGWFHTGDIGDITPDGVKIISRKERMFKLSNGEKLFPANIEENVCRRCKFVKYAYVFGSGQKNPFMLIFPNSELMAASVRHQMDDPVCKFPGDCKSLSNCLSSCVDEINTYQLTGIERIGKALVIQRELSLEENELTPSFKLIPRRIEEKYKPYIDAMQAEDYDSLPHDAYVINLE